MILRCYRDASLLSLAKHPGYSRSRFVSTLAPPRANTRSPPLCLGSVRLKISPSLRPLFAAVRVPPYSLAYIKNSAESLRLFSHNSAFRTLFSSAPTRPSLYLPLSLSSSVSDSLSTARFPYNKPVSLARHHLLLLLLFLLLFIVIILRPSVSSLWHPCARTYTRHTARLSCDLAIRDTESRRPRRREADYSPILLLSFSCSSFFGFATREKPPARQLFSRSPSVFHPPRMRLGFSRHVDRISLTLIFDFDFRRLIGRWTGFRESAKREQGRIHHHRPFSRGNSTTLDPLFLELYFPPSDESLLYFPAPLLSSASSSSSSSSSSKFLLLPPPPSLSRPSFLSLFLFLALFLSPGVYALTCGTRSYVPDGGASA